MVTKQDSIAVTLGADVGLGGSFTVNYPTGRTAEDYLGGTHHFIASQSARTLFANSGDFALTFGASNITVTIKAAHSFASGSKLWVNIDRADITESAGELPSLANTNNMAEFQVVKVTLGTPLTAAATAVVASQAASAATGLATGINGAQAVAGVVTFNTPRNIVAAWTGTSVLTVTGEDEHGAKMSESSASGTSFTGKKAFKKVTKVTVSADVTGLTVGTGVILGLPVFLPDVADVLKEIQDGVAATAGTVAAGVVGTQTATTGDVRGTYSPNSAPNGTRVYELTLAVRNPAYKGATQYAA